MMEVTVKIGATVSAGHAWPKLSPCGNPGDVVPDQPTNQGRRMLRCKFEAAMAFLPTIRFLEPEFDD